MSTDAVPTVLVETTGVVGRITLNAPERLNAVDPGMCEVVADAVRAFDDDPAVRVIALTGAGRGFCSGAPLSADGATQGTLYAGADLVRALLASRTPVVALVNGVAAGIGVPMALACDYVLASDAASFVLAFARIGLMPDGGSTALVAASIGRARAMRLALTGEKLDAVTAAEWGLVAECVAAEEFPARVRGPAGRLRGGSHAGTGGDQGSRQRGIRRRRGGVGAGGGRPDRADAHAGLPRGRRGVPRQAARGVHRPLNRTVTPRAYRDRPIGHSGYGAGSRESRNTSITRSC